MTEIMKYISENQDLIVKFVGAIVPILVAVITAIQQWSKARAATGALDIVGRVIERTGEQAQANRSAAQVNMVKGIKQLVAWDQAASPRSIQKQIDKMVKRVSLVKRVSK